MLIRPPDEPGAENQEARQRYEVMQCFTVSQPKSFKEEGEGRAERPVLPAVLWEGGRDELPLQNFARSPKNRQADFEGALLRDAGSACAHCGY